MKVIVQMLVTAALTWTTSCEEVVYVKEGDAATFRLDGLDPTSKYLYWSHSKLQQGWLAWLHPMVHDWSVTQDARWANRLLVSKDALTIKDVTQDDFGSTVVFSRLVDNQGDITPMKTFRISKITVSADPKQTPLLIGEAVLLSCRVDTPPGHRQPSMYWLDPAGEKMSPSGGQLQLVVTSRDNGRWSCVVVRDGGEDRASLFITVIDLSPAPEYPVYTSEQSPLTIRCPFAGNVSWKQFQSRGVSEVRWQYTSQLLGHQIIVNKETLLTFSPPNAEQGWRSNTSRGRSFDADFQTSSLVLSKKHWRAEDRGHYTCSFKFSERTFLQRVVSVEVLQVVSSAGSVLDSGQSVNLTCSLGKALPRDHWLKWFPPERSATRFLFSSGRPGPAQIVIPEVGPDDGDRWGCELWCNSTRVTWAGITLTVNRRLSTGMLVSLSGAAVIIAVLLLLICITWRRRQRKTRRRRHHVCRCKQPKPKGFSTYDDSISKGLHFQTR
ncbi:CD4-1 molecule [Vanacampus margaritifer]